MSEILQGRWQSSSAGLRYAKVEIEADTTLGERRKQADNKLNP